MLISSKWTSENDSSLNIILYMYNWKEAFLNNEPFYVKVLSIKRYMFDNIYIYIYKKRRYVL